MADVPEVLRLLTERIRFEGFAARCRTCRQKVKEVEGEEALGPLYLSRKIGPARPIRLVLGGSVVDGFAGLPSTWIAIESLTAGFTRQATRPVQLLWVLRNEPARSDILQVR
jgi:hypothetical protein